MDNQHKVQVLFVCTGNSARSQISEGLLRNTAGDMVDVYSAGTKPADQVNPLAKKVMAENGIDISDQYPKMLDQYIKKEFDVVVTTCDSARQSCPVFPGNAEVFHWNLEDPAAATGGESERLAAFRKAYAEISERMSQLMPVIREISGQQTEN